MAVPLVLICIAVHRAEEISTLIDPPSITHPRTIIKHEIKALLEPIGLPIYVSRSRELQKGKIAFQGLPQVPCRTAVGPLPARCSDNARNDMHGPQRTFVPAKRRSGGRLKQALASGFSDRLSKSGKRGYMYCSKVEAIFKKIVVGVQLSKKTLIRILVQLIDVVA